MVKKIASRVYMGLIFLFLYLPILVLIGTITRYFFIVFKRNEKRVQNYKLLPAVPIPNNRYI